VFPLCCLIHRSTLLLLLDFGFLDGFGQPYVDGFSDGAQPGFSVIPPGILLLGNNGDLKASQRPKWSKDGSFLVFRQLQELAPEFDAFIMDNAIQDPTGKVQLTQREGADLLAARMFGRWPSGAAIDLTPLRENTTLAEDAVINDFDFNHPGFDLRTDQSHCPFSAHIRKVRPRADQNNSNVRNQMLRAGLPYGPEQTDEEIAKKKSLIERGLAFTAYQSSLDDGFRFQQISMANNAS
jgi:Dyp-type peroxidase family